MEQIQMLYLMIFGALVLRINNGGKLRKVNYQTNHLFSKIVEHNINPASRKNVKAT